MRHFLMCHLVYASTGSVWCVCVCDCVFVSNGLLCVVCEQQKGFTPLHIAAKYSNVPVSKILLSKGANPNAEGKNGLTPLHVATHYNSVEVAQLLTENKANPHAAAKVSGVNCCTVNAYQDINSRPTH